MEELFWWSEGYRSKQKARNVRADLNSKFGFKVGKITPTFVLKTLEGALFGVVTVTEE